MVLTPRRRRWPALVLAGALLAALAPGCSRTGGGGYGGLAEAVPVFPGDEWDEATPTELGIDETVLDELAAEAEAGNSTCFLVARDGRVAGEWYWAATGPDDTHEVFSVTKSIASTLVGLAVGDGDLAVEDPVATWVGSWRGTASEDVTVRDLLSMDSGRARDLGSDYLAIVAAPDRTRYSVGLGQTSPPGTTWAYSNTAVQVLEPVLSEATGVDPVDYARERLFEPLGMDRTFLTTDLAGNASLAFGAQTTCRDLARLGLLILSDGVWDGTRILPEGWVAEATSPSTDLNVGYGYLWWLNEDGRVVDSALAVSAQGDEDPVGGRQVPGAPTDLVWALGLGEQILQIHPDSGTILVRIGGNAPAGTSPFTEDDASRLVTEGLLS
ncbi:MAG: serine hydrolase [Acidimicrobiales bacterium]|nr:serine hydrolase [Acidimicrobiales bacterium]